MKSKKIHEHNAFQRGKDPLDSLQIGEEYKFKNLEERAEWVTQELNNLNLLTDDYDDYNIKMYNIDENQEYVIILLRKNIKIAYFVPNTKNSNELNIKGWAIKHPSHPKSSFTNKNFVEFSFNEMIEELIDIIHGDLTDINILIKDLIDQVNSIEKKIDRFKNAKKYLE